MSTNPKVDNHKYKIIILCPNCKTRLKTKYDYKKMETTCRKCGLVLKAPPEYGIIYPNVIKIKKSIKE
ncbi:TFIIB-type zinc ribbon-containing protein [Methanosphaera sp.]|uniref:TFIIB-type zinc ribbon-containing protein n=1 Tax=Methanosphaera sp. TaxID=2666342 RepID=UPI0025ECF092|nr:TFIIB-type zinc ribbon-containing protein [Methanosphaera sp.]